MCGGTSVFKALEAYGDNDMASAPSGKTPPLQFPMEKQEPYVIIPEADADLRAWVSRDFCCPHNLWCWELPEQGEFEAGIIYMKAGRRVPRRVKALCRLREFSVFTMFWPCFQACCHMMTRN